MRQPFEISFENDTPTIVLPLETTAVNATKLAQARAVELPGVLVTLSRGGRKIASWAQPPDVDAGLRARQERTRQAEARLAAEFGG